MRVRTRNGALADIFPSTTNQGFGHPKGMVRAVSYKQYQRPLCFSRPLVMTLAVPLFLLMIVRGRRAGPAANRCSVIGIAFISEFQPEFPKAPLLKVTGQGSPSISSMGYKEKKQVSPMLLGSNLSTATKQGCKLGKVTNFFERWYLHLLSGEKGEDNSFYL